MKPLYEQPTPSEIVERKEEEEIFEKAFASLAEKDKDVLRHCFWGEEVTLDSIGKQYGITHSGVGVRRNKALRRFRTALQSRQDDVSVFLPTPDENFQRKWDASKVKEEKKRFYYSDAEFAEIYQLSEKMLVPNQQGFIESNVFVTYRALDALNEDFSKGVYRNPRRFSEELAPYIRSAELALSEFETGAVVPDLLHHRDPLQRIFLTAYARKNEFEALEKLVHQKYTPKDAWQNRVAHHVADLELYGVHVPKLSGD